MPLKKIIMKRIVKVLLIVLMIKILYDLSNTIRANMDIKGIQISQLSLKEEKLKTENSHSTQLQIIKAQNNTTSTPLRNSIPINLDTLTNLSDFQDNRKLLAIMATSCLPEKQKENVHKNVARLWGSWYGIIQPVVYTDLKMLNKSFDSFIESKWKILPISRMECSGIPVLKVMMMNLPQMFPNSDFYIFANSDILFDEGFIETLRFVKNQTQDKPVMIIGQRTNVDFVSPIIVNSPSEVSELAKKGKIMKAYAIDYFITNRLFPWQKFPNLVIGRHQYDNYLVFFSLLHKAILIDATKTIKAVHQTTKDGNNSGNHRHDKNCNRNMIKKMGKPFYSSWGFVTCAKLYTHRNKEGLIKMSSRKAWRYCNQEYS